MESENVRLMHDALAAMERGDLDAIAALADPDVEFVNPPSALEPGTRRGHEGLKTGLGGMLEAFAELRIEPHRIVDRGDTVVVTGVFSGRGRGSGYRFDPQPFGFLVRLRDGRVVRYEWFADRDEALQAAGLEEPGI
jgi:ketosteroid isomerase-like protein